MFRILQFISSDQETIEVQVPKKLRGKLVEIVIQEKAPDADTKLTENDEQQMANKEAELQLLNKLRNQLNGWDM